MSQITATAVKRNSSKAPKPLIVKASTLEQARRQRKRMMNARASASGPSMTAAAAAAASVAHSSAMSSPIVSSPITRPIALTAGAAGGDAGGSVPYNHFRFLFKNSTEQEMTFCQSSSQNQAKIPAGAQAPFTFPNPFLPKLLVSVDHYFFFFVFSLLLLLLRCSLN